MSTSDLCKICNKVQFKYSCPKCNIGYCSVQCYRSPEHQKCSEEFYKKSVEDELSRTASDKRSSEDIQKMHDILQRMNQQFVENEFDIDGPSHNVDSDDDNDADETDNMASRLEGIDINDSDEVWSHLTEEERSNFQELIENGEIMKLLPKYQPWWSTQSNKLVVPIADENIPNLCENIPPFNTIYSKEPPLCIHNNLWNVIASYACTVKFFNGEHKANPWEAACYLVALSTNLKGNVNFDDAEQAMASIQMEALTEKLALPCEEFTEIQKDCRQIMSTMNFKLAALSDTLNLFTIAKEHRFGKVSKVKTCEFTQKFGGIFVDLSKSKLNLVGKKIEFFLSFVKRDSK